MFEIIMLIYLADIVNSLSFSFGVVGVIGCIISLLYLGHQLDIKERVKLKFIIISFCVILLSCLIPSKESIYLIAGVKLGNDVTQEILNSEYTNKIKFVIDHELDKIIDGVKNENTKRNN